MFAGLVEAEGIRRGAHHVRQTILGEGAPWIWNIAAAKFPEATQVVDLFHAREHLHELAGILELMLGDQRKDWLAARLDDLATATSTASAPPELIPLSAAGKTTWAGRWARRNRRPVCATSGSAPVEASSQWEAICMRPRTQTGAA